MATLFHIIRCEKQLQETSTRDFPEPLKAEAKWGQKVNLALY